MIKKILAGIGITLLVIILAVVGFRIWADATYFNEYNPKAPFNVNIREVTVVNQGDPNKEYQLIHFYFAGVNGEMVPTLMTIPNKGWEKYPVVIFLHGIGQKKDFLKEITMPFIETGFAMACFDQLMQGERKLPPEAGWLQQYRAFRKRPARTINETRRLIDYLSGHPQIDTRRIYLVGASYGAITGSTVLSFDKRIRAGILIYGGADIPTMLDAPLIRQEGGWLVSLAKPVAWFCLGVADPKHYVAGIAPTPVYVQAGKRDQLVWPKASQALIDAIGTPTKVTWYDSDHIGSDRATNFSNTKQVLKDGLTWLLEHDDPFRSEDQKVSELPSFEIGDV